MFEYQTRTQRARPAPTRNDTVAATADPGPAKIMHSFSRIGVEAVQPKLTVNAPGDSFEQEADAVAEKVMRSETAGPAPVTGSTASAGAAAGPPSDVDDVVSHGLSGGGRALDPATQAFMKPRFGYDFSSVHVHDDEPASRSAQAISAKAFTLGSDIAFRSGEYDPGSASGKRLLAHELTHVVQQRAATAAPNTVQRDDGDPDVGVGAGAGATQADSAADTNSSTAPSSSGYGGANAASDAVNIGLGVCGMAPDGIGAACTAAGMGVGAASGPSADDPNYDYNKGTQVAGLGLGAASLLGLSAAGPLGLALAGATAAGNIGGYVLNEMVGNMNPANMGPDPIDEAWGNGNW